MSFYSFVVWAPDEIPLPRIRVLLERGTNAFNGVIEDVEAFKAHLVSKGCTIVKTCQLDAHTPVRPMEEMTHEDLERLGGRPISPEEVLLMQGNNEPSSPS